MPHYNRMQIAWEIEQIAKGHAFYGNALRVAKDLPEVNATDRAVLDRYATGGHTATDHIDLQEIAMKIYTTAEQ